MNKWNKTPDPGKETLEKLYHIDFLSQSEIASKFDTTQKVVWRWFRDLNIKSRKPFKRNQLAENNDSWKGENATYSALHYRVISAKGRPKECEVCQTKDISKTYDWACIGDYYNINDYIRMCRSCHWKHDKISNNFPNNNRTPQSSSKKVKIKCN